MCLCLFIVQNKLNKRFDSMDECIRVQSDEQLSDDIDRNEIHTRQSKQA